MLVRGKPPGVSGAEVWVKLVDAPPSGQPVPTAPIGDPKTFSFLTLTTRPTPQRSAPTSAPPTAAGGKTSARMHRWVNTRGGGEKGPWSEVTTATVAA